MRFIQPAVLFDVCPNIGVSISYFVLDKGYTLIHVRTSHVPRFEVELPSDKAIVKESLFSQMGICYDDFRKLEMQEKMKYIRAYARKIHPDGRLWWVEEREDSDEHTTPIQARLYTNLSIEEKTKLGLKQRCSALL